MRRLRITMLIGGDSVVRLHELRTRPDGDEWIVGRIDTGDFVAVPLAGVRAIELLRYGRRIEQCREELRADGFGDLDVADFLAELTSLGFVASIDGREVDASPPLRPSLPWLRPEYTRWAQSRAVHVAVGTVIAAGLITAVTHPTCLPRPDGLVWSGNGSLVLLGQTVLVVMLIALHELAHLVTARAAGVPGFIRLSTRLQFLVAQTDVSGVWAVGRRHRMTVYLCGMAIDAAVAAIAVMVLAATAPSTVAHRIAAVVALTEVMLLAPQFLVFMRTDLYLVLQDHTGSRDLYADGSAYIRHLVGRLLRRGSAGEDPVRLLPRRERRTILGYAVLLVIGTPICLGVAAVVSLPAAVHILGQSAAAFGADRTWPRMVDAVVVFLVIAGSQALWCRLWWQRHGPRVRRWLTAARASWRPNRYEPSSGPPDDVSRPCLSPIDSDQRRPSTRWPPAPPGPDTTT